MNQILIKRIVRRKVKCIYESVVLFSERSGDTHNKINEENYFSKMYDRDSLVKEQPSQPMMNTRTRKFVDAGCSPMQNTSRGKQFCLKGEKHKTQDSVCCLDDNLFNSASKLFFKLPYTRENQ